MSFFLDNVIFEKISVSEGAFVIWKKSFTPSPYAPLLKEGTAPPSLDEGLVLPRHLAVIMDGNGRWAKARALPRSLGHAQGVEAIHRTIRAVLKYRIPYLTIFSFSSENWSRPPEEISALFFLLRRSLKQDIALLHEQGVKVLILGDRSSLEPDIVQKIHEAETLTRDNTTLTLSIAFNYGGRQEITQAVQKMAQWVKEGRLAPEEITTERISSFLYAPSIPDPDLLIRTSGEERLSNFLLWQIAYTELVFMEKHWPDFDEHTLLEALRIFSERQRRFGGVSAP